MEYLMNLYGGNVISYMYLYWILNICVFSLLVKIGSRDSMSFTIWSAMVFALVIYSIFGHVITTVSGNIFIVGVTIVIEWIGCVVMGLMSYKLYDDTRNHLRRRRDDTAESTHLDSADYHKDRNISE